MTDASDEMLAAYFAMDVMEPLAQEIIKRELGMEEVTEIDERLVE